MSDNKDVRRGIVLYLDGKEVVNNITAIEAECRKLVMEQKSMTRGSKEYIEQGKKIRTLKGILSEHNQQLREINQTQTLSLSKGVDLFNKYAASIMAVVAALTGVVLKLNTFRNLLNEREEAKANVKALTGLDDDAIDWMEQKAVELSTTMDESGLRIRQSASEIMEAYMMVGSNKPEVLESKEALNAVTVETMRLAAASGMSLTKSVDATTTALNQYGASADDAAKYVNVLAAGSKYGAANVEQQSAAILKAGTIAASSNIPIEEFVATIEMLGEKGIKSEIAGTGLKTFFTRLATGATDTNPKVVGLSVALDNLNKKVEVAEKQKVGGGTALLKKLFGDEGMQTAMILSQNTEKVKSYTQAVTDTSIAYEQAAINSDTAAAKLDQVKNELNEQGIILMKELNPAITRTLSRLVNWSKYTVTLVRFIADHRSALGILTTAIILYTVWVNKKIILDKLQVLWNEKVLVSIKSINTALKTTPWLAIASAVLIVIGALVDYQRNQNKITQSMLSLESINKKTSDEYEEQAAKIDRLTQMINNNNLSLAIRREKLDELKSIIPDYNAQLTDEGTILNNNTEAIKKYLVELEKQIKLKAAQDELEELYKKQRLAGKQLKKETEERDDNEPNYPRGSLTSVYQSGASGQSGWDLYDRLDLKVRTTANHLEELKDAIEDVNKEIVSTSTSIVTPTSETDNDTGGNGDGGGESETEKQKRIKKKMAGIEAEYLKKQSDLKEQYMKSDTMSQQDYANELEKLELDKLDELMKIAGLEPEKREAINQKVVDAKLKLYEKIKDIGRTNAINDESTLNAELDRIQKDYDKKLSLLDYALKKEVITLKEYNNQKKKIDKDAADERNKANEAAAQKRLKKEERIYGKEVLALRRARIKENLTDEQYNDRLRDSRLKWLERMLDDLKLSEEDRLKLEQEYQEMILEGDEAAYEKRVEKFNKLKENIMSSSEELGQSLADFFINEETDLGDFMGNVLSILLDSLEKQLIATQAAAIATVSMNEITTKGWIGIATAAAKIALITAAFETAKGFLGNFYTGGYTGDGNWDEPKGIVHSDEFVANRFAVANPAVRPVLDLIDNAQRTGSVSNLTAEDITAVAGSGASEQRNVMIIPASTKVGLGDSPELLQMLRILNQTMNEAKEAYENPSPAYCWAEGKGGVNDAQRLVEKMKNNVKRR